LNRQANRAERRRSIARILIVAIILGGLPFAAAGLLTDRAPTPAFTLDICHPLSPCAVGLAAGDLPPLTVFAFAHHSIDLGAAPDFTAARAARAPQAPDPPPPKLLA
jgi:hypothetical protein